jgi:hypothetical protein
MQKVVYWGQMQKHFASRQIICLNGTVTFLESCSADSSRHPASISIVAGYGQVLKSFLLENKEKGNV